MNGEMHLICCITAAAKEALKRKSLISSSFEYIERVEFQFISNEEKVENITKWYNYCVKNGLIDIKFLAPISVKDRNILGFANTSQSSIVCFYETGKVTYFTAQWDFDSNQKNWDVLYTENEWSDAPSGRPHFENNTEDFKSVLSQIRDLAINIECDGFFTQKFQEAYTVLSDLNKPQNKYLPEEMPYENLRLFSAASIADVFGAMGSWNDSPPFMAEDKGLLKEYNSLSNELLKQIRLALLYSINEW